MSKDLVLQKMFNRLQSTIVSRRKLESDSDLAKSVQSLRDYQSQRLRATHNQWLENSDTRAAGEFFFDEIYSEKNSLSRDLETQKFLPTIGKILPLGAIETIASALELDGLTLELDIAMAEVLGSSFSDGAYLQAFSQLGPIDSRLEQVRLVSTLGENLCEVVRIPFISTALKIMRPAARMARIESLHEFLEQGFNTFSKTKSAKLFVRSMTTLEASIIYSIFEQKPSTWQQIGQFTQSSNIEDLRSVVIKV